jgi:hypothetical protein
MRQALHIFRKDVRFLWPQIVVVLAMTALFAWSRSVEASIFGRRNPIGGNDLRDTISFFLMMGWLYFIACLVYKEPPVGDRQFWVTRPYSWKSLLAAKALSIVLFLNLPFLISDIVIVSANGLSPAKAAANLLGRQLAIAAILLLPMAALAATTRYLAQMVFTLAVVFGVNIVLNPPYNLWGRLSWIPECTSAAILTAGTFAILAWQYAQRRTPISRTILAAIAGICFAVLMSKPVGPAVALQSHFPRALEDMPGVRLTFAPGPLPKGVPISPNQVFIFEPAARGWIPIRIDGIVSGVQVKADLVEVQIRGPEGTSWSSGWVHPTSPPPARRPIEWMQGWNETRFLYVRVGGHELEAFQSQPVNVTISIAMTAVRSETTIRMTPNQSLQSIAGLGACSILSVDAPGSPWLRCRSAEGRLVGLDVYGLPLFEASYAPNQAIFAESPIAAFSISLEDRRSLFNEGPIYITTWRPVAHIRRDLEIPQIRLGEVPSH